MQRKPPDEATAAPARCLIAEDEPLLAAGLQADLAALWPALQVVASVGDGLRATEQALALQPEVCFFDIRMPSASGQRAPKRSESRPAVTASSIGKAEKVAPNMPTTNGCAPSSSAYSGNATREDCTTMPMHMFSAKIR